MPEESFPKVREGAIVETMGSRSEFSCGCTCVLGIYNLSVEVRVWEVTIPIIIIQNIHEASCNESNLVQSGVFYHMKVCPL